LRVARGALVVAAVAGKIHAVGGVGRNRRNSPAHEVYDPANDSWRDLAPLPTPRDHLAAAVVDGRLYAIGGRVNGSYARNLAVNEVYDAAADRWRRRAPMPNPRSGIAAAVLGGRILVFGGEAPAGTFDLVGSYDPRRDSWTLETPMPTARHGLGSVTLDGRTQPGGSVSARNEIFSRSKN